MVLLRHYSLLSLSIDWHFSSTGRWRFVVSVFFVLFCCFFYWGESRSATGQKHCSFKGFHNLVYLCPCRRLQPIMPVYSQHEIWFSSECEHTGLILIATQGEPRLSAHSGLNNTYNSGLTPLMMFSFHGGLLPKHKAEWRTSYCIVVTCSCFCHIYLCVVLVIVLVLSITSAQFFCTTEN